MVYRWEGVWRACDPPPYPEIHELRSNQQSPTGRAHGEVEYPWESQDSGLEKKVEVKRSLLGLNRCSRRHNRMVLKEE